jgi:hypothetical protein
MTISNKVELCATMKTIHKQGWASIRHWQRVQYEKSMKEKKFTVGRTTILWPTHPPYSKLGGAKLIAKVHYWSYKNSWVHCYVYTHLA